MFRFPELVPMLLAGLFTGQVLAAEASRIGRPATAEEIAAWDIDVRPDGQGLPPGQGSAAEGETIYTARCAQCHGDFGEGIGSYPALMGGVGSLGTNTPVRTVGSYWPYATTLWDYIRRTMPFGEAQSLTPDETYAVTAYVLYLNDLIEEDRSLDQATLPLVEMPNRNGFVDPLQPGTSRNLPCMSNCSATATVTRVAPSLEQTIGESGN